MSPQSLGFATYSNRELARETNIPAANRRLEAEERDGGGSRGPHMPSRGFAYPSGCSGLLLP